MSKLKDAKILQILQNHSSDVTCLCFWGNILLISGSSDKTVRLWKWTVGEGFVENSNSPLMGHRYGVTDLKISPQGGVLASSSVDGTVILWNLGTGKKIGILHQENGEAIRCCAFSPNGAFIAGADDGGAICIWDQNKSLLKHIKYHEETIYTIVFSPDSQVCLSGCNSGMLRMTLMHHDVETAENEFQCGIDNCHDLGVRGADFCKFMYRDPNDSNTIIYTAATCGTDNCIKIWRIFYLSGPNKSIGKKRRSKLIPKTGEHDSGTSTVYSTSIMNAECVVCWTAHASSVNCVKFNNRGTFLMSCGLDKTIKLWNLQGNCIQTLTEHARYVNCVIANEESTILASGSNDKSVIIWDLTSSLTLDSRIGGLSSMLFNLASNEVEIPLELICPITHEIIQHPVLSEDGFTYEREAITEWFEGGHTTSPMTNLSLTSLELTDNDELKEKIDEFLKSMDFDKFDGAE